MSFDCFPTELLAFLLYQFLGTFKYMLGGLVLCLGYELQIFFFLTCHLTFDFVYSVFLRCRGFHFYVV